MSKQFALAGEKQKRIEDEKNENHAQHKNHGKRSLRGLRVQRAGGQGLSGKLTIQPECQRNYVYAEENKEIAVINNKFNFKRLSAGVDLLQ